MRVDGQTRRSIEAAASGDAVVVIDQRQLPHRWALERLDSPDLVRQAIVEMWVRGAPLIGVTAAFGMALQCRRDASDAALSACKVWLDGARPTAVNLSWATRRLLHELLRRPTQDRAAAAWALALEMADEDVSINQAIGAHGLQVLQARALQTGAGRPGQPLQILTHCNAGWLATVDWGTALAPIYKAHQEGLAVHVWVDETRPRNQGASLTAWELAHEGIAHTLIADNAGGHLMQHGQVDLVLVGADRVTSQGDVCNKIGTYLKALAAHDNGVPFFVAMPTSTLDMSLHDGLAEIPVEHRSARELTHITGLAASGQLTEVALAPPNCAAANPAFDVTPGRLVTGLITELGVCEASAPAIRGLLDLK